MNYRIITAPPRDKNESLILICSVIAKNVGRLEKLLKEYEAIEAEEADERYDRAALDCSRAFERHRRYQSARTREWLRVLEEFRRMRTEEGKRKMADREWQMTDGEVEATGLVVGQDSNLVLEESTNVEIGILSHEDMEATDVVGEGPVVGHDSNLVTEDPTNDKIAILSHEETDVAEGPGQGAGDRQGPPSSVPAPEKAQNKANFKSTQSIEPAAVQSDIARGGGSKRSQIARGETSTKPARPTSRTLSEARRWGQTSDDQRRGNSHPT